MKLHHFSVHDIPRRRFIELTMKGGLAVAATPALFSQLTACRSGAAMTALDTDRGLLLNGVTGYGIDSVNGNFSGGASGFWIEKGEILYPVEGLTIAGSADTILNGIDMMGNDIDMNRSFAAPTFRVAEMQIGGR